MEKWLAMMEKKQQQNNNNNTRIHARLFNVVTQE